MDWGRARNKTVTVAETDSENAWALDQAKCFVQVLVTINCLACIALC